MHVPTRVLRRPADGPPVYTWEPAAGVPAVAVWRLGGDDDQRPGELAGGQPHAHDFVVLAYFRRGGVSLRLGMREWRVEAGDVFLVAPGEVVATGDDGAALAAAEGWAVAFPVDVLGAEVPGAFLSWRSHPLLFPFVRGAGAAQRLAVPAGQQAEWSQRIAALSTELAERRDGHHEAVLAHLTLLLVAVARLAGSAGGDLRLHDDELLAGVFGLIERCFAGPLSLKEVAREVGLTGGHLTTVVRRKTGRTVGEWITERRMAEARTLLLQTDLGIGEVAHRAGYRDPAYFVRSFRRTHGTTPLRWRQAAGSATRERS